MEGPAFTNRCGADLQVDPRSTAMGLLERVSTLVRANLNDLVDRAA